jgi:nucleoside-diphosphate-sugar epimerase
MKQTKLDTDLDYILQHTATVWPELKNKRLFITGGTGFIGSWLLETLAWANRKLELNLQVTTLTRNLAAFIKKAPHLVADPALMFLEGDIRNFIFPGETYTHIIHGAADASAKLNLEHPQLMFDTILQGTRHVLEFSAYAHAQKFLLLSSGAVYGRQSPEVTHVTEDYHGYPDIFNPLSAYAVGKRTAEHMCVLHAATHNLQIKIARCFAFVGPYLPLDRHFAIGNFIRDGLSGKTINVNSDGSPFRSYQYAADLVIWLLRILCQGETCLPYNVGSDEPVSIAQLAVLVANSFNPPRAVNIAHVADTAKLPERYVPDVQRAQKNLGLTTHIDLLTAIDKTIQWHKEETVND